MTDRTRTAPFYQIPSNQVVSVEHPAIIQNADKAVDTLQGNSGISKVLPPSYIYIYIYRISPANKANNIRY